MLNKVKRNIEVSAEAHWQKTDDSFGMSAAARRAHALVAVRACLAQRRIKDGRGSNKNVCHVDDNESFVKGYN